VPEHGVVSRLVSENKASIIKVGADLVFRPEGLRKGPFYFAGAGFKTMDKTIAGNYEETSFKEGLSIVCLAFGGGYDFSRYFGVEVRYNSMPTLFSSRTRYQVGQGKWSNWNEWSDDYGKDDINNIQVQVRFRF
jgi:hypothetical protein